MISINTDLLRIKESIYDQCGFIMEKYTADEESTEYNACSFELEGRKIISRSAKVTPKKAGLFVTFWRRTENGPIRPFNESDEFDFFIVNLGNGDFFGQFVFPRSELIKRGVISHGPKEGKRAIRVYPPWEEDLNKEAERTRNWQLNYFLLVNEKEQNLISRATSLYSMVQVLT